MASVDVPKFKVPFSISGTGAEVVEQDSTEEVVQCVEAIVNTPVESRDDDPEFGVPDYLFRQTGEEASEIADAIELWEPRATADIVSDVIDREFERSINVNYEERLNG